MKCHIRSSLLPLLLISTALAAPSLPAQTGAGTAIGVSSDYRDLSVKPGDDFDEYANGGWRDRTEIPADRSSTGVSFEVFQKAEQRNADLVRQAGSGNEVKPGDDLYPRRPTASGCGDPQANNAFAALSRSMPAAIVSGCLAKQRRTTLRTGSSS